jgi:hypothetical protein
VLDTITVSSSCGCGFNTKNLCAATAAGGVLYAGDDAQPLSPKRAANLNRLEDAFQAMQLAAAQLRLAVKTGDAQMAADALKTPIVPNTGASFRNVNPVASERYTQGVIVTAEQPAEFDGTAFNTPVKSQGGSTMAASYAAVAALEATVAARFFGGRFEGSGVGCCSCGRHD